MRNETLQNETLQNKTLQNKTLQNKTLRNETLQNRTLLTLHVATAAGTIGTDLVLVALGIWSMRGADPQTVYPAAHLIGRWVLAPLVVVALASGVILGARTRWGLLRYWWVTIKLALTASLTAVVLFVLVPRLGERADAANATPATPFTTADRMPLAVIPTAGVALLAFAVALAIFKPGGQTPLRRKPRHHRHTRNWQ